MNNYLAKKIICFFGVLLPAFLAGYSQQSARPSHSNYKDKGFAIALSVDAPIGDFAETHLVGAGLDISPARHWFGLFNRKKTAFTYRVGMNYYLGKLEKLPPYDYKYPTYFHFQGLAGLLYTPVRKATISVLAGPALTLSNGDSRFGWVGNINALSFFIDKKLSIGPGVILVKQPGTHSLWSTGVRVMRIL